MMRQDIDWLTGVNVWMEKLNPDVRLLNEGMFDKDMSGWINIGVIKNGSNLGEGGDAYLMVNPKFPKTDDLGTFIYRGTGYNSKPDGTGSELHISEYTKQYLKVYDEYRNTYYGEIFLGKQKTEEEKDKHVQFMNQLDKTGDEIILKHDSSYRITDGVVKKGTPNNWSNNSDVGIYFWGSKQHGSDQSNGSKYTYFCLVNQDEVYDFENDIERLGTLANVFKKYKYAAQYWKGGPTIVVNSVTPVEIDYIRDNTNSIFFNSKWEIHQ